MHLRTVQAYLGAQARQRGREMGHPRAYRLRLLQVPVLESQTSVLSGLYNRRLKFPMAGEAVLFDVEFTGLQSLSVVVSMRQLGAGTAKEIKYRN